MKPMQISHHFLAVLINHSQKEKPCISLCLHNTSEITVIIYNSVFAISAIFLCTDLLSERTPQTAIARVILRISNIQAHLLLGVLRLLPLQNYI